VNEEPGLPDAGSTLLPEEVLLTGALRGSDSVPMWRAFSSRLGRSRSDLATQSWTEFLRGLALECAVIGGIVGVVVLVLWLLHR
jgi:hypothetical protein